MAGGMVFLSATDFYRAVYQCHFIRKNIENISCYIYIGYIDNIDFYFMISIAYTVYIYIYLFMLPLKPRPLDGQRGQREHDDRLSAGVSVSRCP